MPEPASILSATVAAALKTGASALTKQVVKRVLQREGLDSAQTPEKIERALARHMEAAYESCYYLKTILDDQRYEFVDLYAGQTFSVGNSTFDQHAFVDYVASGESVILQGAGGSGKSMFTCFLWLSLFGRDTGTIPLFVELRNLNSTKVDSLFEYIYYSCVEFTDALPLDSFRRGLNSGAFVIILDGFDEVEVDRRDTVEISIQELKDRYTQVPIFVTSRPDYRFRGWQRFANATVNPLSESECVMVLDRAPYPTEQKDRLIREVKNGMYERYHTFLSNPLLIYLTLVTFAYNPNLSNEMHEFYEQAFEALYHRHDRTKGRGFTRKYHSGLPRYQLKRLISLFSLTSYHFQKVAFLDEELSRFVEHAKSIYVSDFEAVPADGFIQDMRENLCLLRVDGLEHVFTHRKLQEYFAAYCLAHVASSNLERFFKTASLRMSDEVLQMVYALNADVFREKYIKPFYDKYRSFFNLTQKAAIVRQFVEIFDPTVVVTYSSEQTMPFYSLVDGKTVDENRGDMLNLLYPQDLASFLYHLGEIKGHHVVRGVAYDRLGQEEIDFIVSLGLDHRNSFVQVELKMIERMEPVKFRVTDELFTRRDEDLVVLEEKPEFPIRGTKVEAALRQAAFALHAAVNAEIAELRNTEDNLGKLFGDTADSPGLGFLA